MAASMRAMLNRFTASVLATSATQDHRFWNIFFIKFRSHLQLNNYMTSRLPTVECCGCSERNGEHCPDDRCLKKCRGNYCVVDFDGVEQVGSSCFFIKINI